MLFVFSCVVFIIGILLTNSKHLDFIGEFISVIAGIIIAISLFVIIGSYATKNAEIASNQQRYDGITYEISSTIYKNDYNISTKNIIDDAKSWNEDLAKNKTLQRDFWVGIYTPNIYDNFQYIDYTTINQ